MCLVTVALDLGRLFQLISLLSHLTLVSHIFSDIDRSLVESRIIHTLKVLRHKEEWGISGHSHFSCWLTWITTYV